ncbi:hypothetical protein BgAZ_202310 [Babesia gibsoni]|uniref:Uncharacterized protein n=1 Tax=Babesia gibsoni TaxID=33632 RepID=A0AAD8P9B2_BABGI|nr:hypothetical protein BgAZ_202310 [Babesia gibsoni]
MKGLAVLISSLIATGLVRCVPPEDRMDFPLTRSLKGQLDFFHEFLVLWNVKKDKYVRILRSHTRSHKVERYYNGIEEDMEVFFTEAVELRALLMKPQEVIYQQIPEEYNDRLLKVFGEAFRAMLYTRDDLISLLDDVDMHLSDECLINDGKAAEILLDYGFPRETLTDSRVKDLKEKLTKILDEGSNLNRLAKIHSVGLTLRVPHTLGEKLAWLHSFSSAAVKNGDIEASLLRLVEHDTNGKEFVDAIKDLQTEDGVLHKVVIDRVCGDDFTANRRVKVSGFREAELERHLGMLKAMVKGLREEIIDAALQLKDGLKGNKKTGKCPFGFDSGDEKDRTDGVRCEPEVLVSEDGPLAKIEKFLHKQEDSLVLDR